MKMTRLMLIAITSLALLSCTPEQGSTTANADKQDDVQPPKSVVSSAQPACAVSLGFDVWEPYQYVDIDGQVRGLDIDVIKHILEDLDCQVTYVRGTWVSLLEDLRQGNVDMLLGASKTEAREAFALFSDSYRTEEFSLYIRKEDDMRSAYEDISDFIENGSKIGVVGDYYYGPRISALLDGELTRDSFVSGIMGELNIARLLDMDIDGFLEDSFVGASIIRRKALGNYIVAHSFSVDTGDIYVMFSKQGVQPEFAQRFDMSLSKMKQNGDYEKIMAKYSQ